MNGRIHLLVKRIRIARRNQLLIVSLIEHVPTLLAQKVHAHSLYSSAKPILISEAAAGIRNVSGLLICDVRTWTHIQFLNARISRHGNVHVTAHSVNSLVLATTINRSAQI